MEPGAGNWETEYVLIENKGVGSQDMTGWYLTDDDDHYYFFPKGFILPGGVSVYVWTKEGTDTDSDLYWGRTSGVWGTATLPPCGMTKIIRWIPTGTHSWWACRSRLIEHRDDRWCSIRLPASCGRRDGFLRHHPVRTYLQ